MHMAAKIEDRLPGDIPETVQQTLVHGSIPALGRPELRTLLIRQTSNCHRNPLCRTIGS